MASLSAGRLSAAEDAAAEDDSPRSTLTPSRTASPSASSTTSSRDQPVLSLAQVSTASSLLV